MLHIKHRLFTRSINKQNNNNNNKNNNIGSDRKTQTKSIDSAERTGEKSDAV